MLQGTDGYLNLLISQVDYITTLRNATKKCNKKLISLQDSCLGPSLANKPANLDFGQFALSLGESVAFQQTPFPISVGRVREKGFKKRQAFSPQDTRNHLNVAFLIQ